jgi:hypothetical protein
MSPVGHIPLRRKREVRLEAIAKNALQVKVRAKKLTKPNKLYVTVNLL